MSLLDVLQDKQLNIFIRNRGEAFDRASSREEVDTVRELVDQALTFRKRLTEQKKVLRDIRNNFGAHLDAERTQTLLEKRHEYEGILQYSETSVGDTFWALPMLASSLIYAGDDKSTVSPIGVLKAAVPDAVLCADYLLFAFVIVRGGAR